MAYPIYADNGWTGRKALWIKQPDNNTDAFHVEFQQKTSDIIVRRDSDQGPIVGKIKLDKWQRYAEIWFENDVRVEMRKEGMWTTTHVVDIPAAPERSPFKWKASHYLGRGGLKLVDKGGLEIAVFDQSHGFGSKVGMLRVNDSGLVEKVFDQIVVTFVAMEEKQRRQRKSGMATGGGGPATTGFGVGGL